MTIYLTRRYQLDVDVIGYALSLWRWWSACCSAWALASSRISSTKSATVWSVLVFILGFSAIPLVNNAILVVIFFALINCAYSVFSTVLKAWFADRLTPEKKRVSSRSNYTILNIGWTVGPPIGTLLVMHSINLPFWLAAACAAFSIGVYSAVSPAGCGRGPAGCCRLVSLSVAA